MAQDGPKMAPRWPKMAPRWPKMASDGRRKAQDGPKMAHDGPRKALLGPSWESKLGSQRLKTCAFRVGETLFFAFGGRLKEEAKPTKAEEPQEEAKDAQQLAQRGSTNIIGPRNSGSRSPWRGVSGVKSYWLIRISQSI